MQAPTLHSFHTSAGRAEPTQLSPPPPPAACPPWSRWVMVPGSPFVLRGGAPSVSRWPSGHRAGLRRVARDIKRAAPHRSATRPFRASPVPRPCRVAAITGGTRTDGLVERLQAKTSPETSQVSHRQPMDPLGGCTGMGSGAAWLRAAPTIKDLAAVGGLIQFGARKVPPSCPCALGPCD